jgi:hypothetical protein
LTQNIGSSDYTTTIATLSDEASIVEAFKYYHQGGLTGSPAANSIEQYFIDINDRADTIDTQIGYDGVSPTPNSVHSRLSTLESTVGGSLSSTYVKAIPSSNDTPATRNLIQPSSSSVIPLAIQGVVGQTADLQQWKTSAGLAARVSSTGAVFSYDGTSTAQVVTVSGSQTLTNKTLSSPISTIGTNVRTGSYTLVLSDQSKLIEYNSGAKGTITIPTNASVAFPIGTYIVILQTNSGQVDIVGAIGVTVNFTPGNTTRTDWSMATLIKRGTDSWVLAGDLTTI